MGMEYIILITVGFIAALTPGPDIFYIVRQGICNKRVSAFWAVFGILVGNSIYILLVGFGVGAIGQSDIFKAIVGLLGAIYLIKISVSIYKDEPKFNKSSCMDKRGIKIFKEALILNLSNPKAMIFFTVVVTPFITDSIVLSLLSLYFGISLAFITSAFLSSLVEISKELMRLINILASITFLIFSLSLFKLSFEAIGRLFFKI
jgi:threonine/homoserine/homoserine lactone efflux protein